MEPNVYLSSGLGDYNTIYYATPVHEEIKQIYYNKKNIKEEQL